MPAGGGAQSAKAERARTRWVASFGGALVLVLNVASCGGRSMRSVSDDDVGGGGGTSGSGAASGHAGMSTTGGVSFGGATPGESSKGGGAGNDAYSRCRLPMDPGSCRAYVDSYWFDASTGVCMPFTYGGCEGNDNRFPTMEACYAECGGLGDANLAACDDSAHCRPKRLAQRCCSLNVREFVGVRVDVDFDCTDPKLGCTPCTADCDYLAEDGYIGATCTNGYCIPFDIRSIDSQSCMTDADCYLRYGVECCPQCDAAQRTSKLVALSDSVDVGLLACGSRARCADACDYSGYSAVCSSSHVCDVVPRPE